MPDRIFLYGVTGSGKTTLAAEIAERTGLPLHRVDDLTWQPGWIPVPVDEQRRRFEAICTGERWVLDTAYSSWRDVPMARAQLIVALDYSRWVSLSRLLRRTLMRVVDHRAICNGNHETLRQAVSRDSIVLWHFRTFTHKRALMRSWARDPTAPDVALLSSPRATRAWLAQL